MFSLVTPPLNAVGAQKVLVLRLWCQALKGIQAQTVILDDGQQGANGACGFSVAAGTPSPERAGAYLWPLGPKLSLCLTPKSPDLGGSIGPLPCTERSLLP